MLARWGPGPNPGAYHDGNNGEEALSKRTVMGLDGIWIVVNVRSSVLCKILGESNIEVISFRNRIFHYIIIKTFYDLLENTYNKWILITRKLTYPFKRIGD